MRNKKVDPETFSCVDPKLYANRFHKFMADNLFTNQIHYRDTFAVHGNELQNNLQF